MKKGRKQKQKKALPIGKKSDVKLKHSKPKETPEERAARQERRKQEKIQCAAQCKKYIKRLQEELLQPSRKHYGGLGYAKASIFLQLDDLDYADQFQDIWDEHIPGFSGKSFKRRKSDAASNMLWRQRLKASQEGVTTAPVEDVVNAGLVVDSGKGQAKKVSASAAAASAPSNKKRLAKQTEKVKLKVTGTSPDLQAQVMAAYRTMKLKQREAEKKGAKGSSRR
eukprot:jgi/Ulvmu1/10339/UM061_0022.1